MKVRIQKREDAVVFILNGEELQFNYDSLNKFISYRIEKKDEKLEVECKPDFNDYLKLLESISEEVLKEDFQKSLKELEEVKAKMDKSEKKIDDNFD